MIKKLNKLLPYYEKFCYLFFLYGVGCFLPLYFQNYYFDMMEDKAYGYYLVMRIEFVLLVILLLIKLITKNFKISNKFFSILLLFFFLTTLISTIFSYAPYYAFTGIRGWYIGFYTIGTLVFTILVLKDVQMPNQYFFIPLYLVVVFVYILTILHSAEIDVFGMHNNIYPTSYHNYLSTIGNINWYVGYLSLTVPLFVTLFLQAKNKLDLTINGITASLGLISIALLGSDGIYLGLGFLSFFIVPFIFNDLTRLKRFAYLLLVFASGLLLSKLLAYDMSGYSAFLRHPLIIFVCFFIGFDIIVFSRKLTNENYNGYKKNLIILLELVLIIVLIIFAIKVIKSGDENWGTGRLLLWKISFEAFNKFPFVRKLIGIGPDLLDNIYAKKSAYDGVVSLSAHNEIIQALLSFGLLGTLFWLMCWAYIFINYSKRKVYRSNKLTAIAMALICYFGQALVNSSTTLNVATLSLLVIIYLKYDNNI